MPHKQKDYFLYLPRTPERERWGVEVLGGGFARIPAKIYYPPTGHPTDHSFNFEKGRVLQSLQILCVTEGKGLNIGYFAQQELDVLHPNDNPLEHMIRLAKELGPNSGEPSREQDLRNYLGTFNFSGDMVKQSVGSMSGGEKARLRCTACDYTHWNNPTALWAVQGTRRSRNQPRILFACSSVSVVYRSRCDYRRSVYWLPRNGNPKACSRSKTSYSRRCCRRTAHSAEGTRRPGP